MTATIEAAMPVVAEEEFAGVLQPIAGNPKGKNLLSMRQLTAEDIYGYIEEATAAESIIRDPNRRGVSLLPFWKLGAVMRQPSTRTAGSMDTAMQKLGGASEVVSGMQGSAEAKGESLPDSWLAFATQVDILAIRTKEDFGPAFAAKTIHDYFWNGKLPEKTPVINLGDGRNEHPSQALGDFFTMHKELVVQRQLGSLAEKTVVLVGDHERYRAFHSDLLGAVALGMQVIAVESEAAQVPQRYVEAAGSNLLRTDDLDWALRQANVLLMGRNPDEYEGDNEAEHTRSRRLAGDYERWVVDLERLQLMPEDSISLHPRPRRNELHPSVDFDKRSADIQQMANMIPMRMGIIATHLGKSIAAAA